MKMQLERPATEGRRSANHEAFANRTVVDSFHLSHGRLINKILMRDRTIASHYLPRTYLKHFLKDGELVMFKKGDKFFGEGTTPEDRTVGVKGEAGLKNIAQENNLYLVEVPNLDPNAIEDLFREMIEDDIDSIITGAESLGPNSTIGEDLKKKIALLMATMFVRTPNFKREIEDSSTQARKHFTSRTIEYVDRDLFKKTYEEENGKKINDADLEQAIQDLKDGKYDLHWKNAYFLKFALSTVESFAEIFVRMNMRLMIAPGTRFFVTSDNPVVYFVPREHVKTFYDAPRSLVHPHTEVFFPLTKQLGVTLNRKASSDEAINANRELVDVFNFNILQNSRDYIFSPITMQSARRYVEKYVPYPWKFTIS